MKKNDILLGFNVDSGAIVKMKVIRVNKSFIKVCHILSSGIIDGEYRLTKIKESDCNYKYERTGYVYEVIGDGDSNIKLVTSKYECKRASVRINLYMEKIRNRQSEISKINAEILELEELIKLNEDKIKNTEELNGKN